MALLKNEHTKPTEIIVFYASIKKKSVSVNKEKEKNGYLISSDSIITNNFVLLQRGKKNVFYLKLFNK